jgi:4a-hydroxytetrahydrobiopterin dehydratase
MAHAEPLADDEIERRLGELDGWSRDGNEITKTFAHTWHECVHLAMYVAAKAREVGHHPDIDIRWQRIRFGISTHDSGHRITDLDFALARHIDAIAAGHGAKSVARGRRPPTFVSAGESCTGPFSGPDT